MDTPAIGAPARQPVVFGVYRDGDNNLDAAQERNVTDFVATTAHNPALKVVAEDTTSLGRAPFDPGDLRTESSIIQGGTQHVIRVTRPRDMSDRATLASFVAQTLTDKAADPKFAGAPVWIDLVDHGGGDGGGLEADSSGGFMSMQDIAGAIDDGKKRFAAAHPGADADVTGVVANQCLMATLGFASGYRTPRPKRPVSHIQGRPAVASQLTLRCRIANQKRLTILASLAATWVRFSQSTTDY